MPIIETVEQLADFLEQNEEWRRKIYSILVPRELARLPVDLEEFRAETRREFDNLRREMREGFARVDERFAQVDSEFEKVRAEMREGFERVDRELKEVRAEMRENDAQLGQKIQKNTEKIQKNTDDIAELKGMSLEQQYRSRARSLFGRYFRNVVVIDWIDLEEQLNAVEPLSEAERVELSVTDLLARGRRQTDGQETVLVVEVSWSIAPYDVERVVRRAEIFTRRGIAAIPIVAGREVSDDARSVAQQMGCAIVLDGRYEFDQPLQT
jgi:DNA repair exonuclease SbcCD ATPase subunit